MVIVFDMNLGYISQSIEYITCGYGFMLCITFGYVVLKTMWYSFDVVLCDFNAILYYMLYSIVHCIVLYVVYGFWKK